ncbi:hypothetical protein ACF0H5_008221 [Mactra antiquata]
MDNRQISDLTNICRELNSEKARERKAAAVKLKTYICQNSYRKALDKNYEYKLANKNAGRVFTWDTVFRATCGFLSMETEDLKKANQDVSRITLSNRESRKQEISGLVKCVIKQADKGYPKLKGSLLFEHIRDVLQDSYTYDSYGQDYCSIFLKNVLSMKKYVVELKAEEWREFLSMFFNIYKDSETKIDKLILARIIHAMMCCMKIQCDIRPKKVFSFFSEFFLKAKEHKSPLLIQHMLCGMNVFIKSLGSTSRVQICKLGEDIIPSILYLWRNVASDELKDHIVEFLQTQMSCHHPGGVKRDCPGSYALHWDKWMSNLKKLYELLYSEIQQLQTRNRGKSFYLQDKFVALSVDVCQQLFSESSHIIEVTQLSMTGTSSHSGPGTKKRRLESGWEEIRNFISSAGQSVKMVPWLQLVTGHVSKYPTSIPTEEVFPYLTCLSHVLVDCKRTDLMKYVMSCIKSFVCHWTDISNRSEYLHEQTCNIWTQVWIVTLRFVRLHSAEPDGYSLLSALVKHKLVSPRKDIWSLFIPSLTQPITESVTFLHNLLVNCDFLENYVPDLTIAVLSAQGDVKYPLRKQLIDWLIPSNDDDCELPIKHCKIAPDWTALVLVALTLRDMSSVRGRSDFGDDRQEKLSTLEVQCLELDLEQPMEIEKKLIQKPKRQFTSDAVLIPSLLHHVENKIKSEVQCHCSKLIEQMADIKEVVIFTRLVSNILQLLIENTILTQVNVVQSSLYTSMVSLLKKISTCLQDVVKKDSYSGIGIILNELKVLYDLSSVCSQDHGNRNQESIKLMASVQRLATPSRLIDLLLDITNDKHNPARQTSNTSIDTSMNGSRLSRGTSRILDDIIDPLDLEFDDNSNNNNNVAMETEDLDFDDATSSQDGDENTSTDEVYQSVISRNSLSESQILRLESLYILCEISRYDSIISDKNIVDIKYIKNKIMKLLDEDAFDPSRNIDVQMMIFIVKSFTNRHQILSEKHLTVLVDAISCCVKHHKRDQEVCETILELLVMLVPHLATDTGMSNNGLQESRDIVLSLVNAFWKLQEDVYITSVRARMASVLEHLVQYDPDCIWSSFPILRDNDDSLTQDEDKGPTPVSRFIDCLSDNNHYVRIQVASAIYKLFININIEGHPPLHHKSQIEHLDIIVNTLSCSLDIQGKLQPERLKDEKITRQCSMLVTLGTIICTSNICEKQAVFTLIKFIQDRNVPIDDVIKV